jgi:hypothetical protein
LSFALSWYKGIDLDQLEHLRKDGLNDVDLAKLHRCACAIIECADTDALFDAGEAEGDKVMGDAELELSGFTGSPVGTPEDSAYDLDLAPPSPIATDFVLAARTPEDSLLKPVDTPAGP